MLYTFTKLSSELDRRGFPKALKRNFEPARTELRLEERAGRIVFKDDGVYRIIDGIEYKGYMYLKRYFIQRYHEYPKFHITKCSTVAEIEKRIDFVWDRSPLAKIQDRDNFQFYEAKLALCGNCAKEATISPKTTDDFRKLLDEEQQKNVVEHIELDMRGRPLNWEIVSKSYRVQKNYTCEKCGFGHNMLQSIIDREFIHTDHKVAWELSNINENNLQCLCILCHSQKDEIHKTNFSKKGMRKRLNRFIEKYGEKLREIGNPYIDHLKENDDHSK